MGFKMVPRNSTRRSQFAHWHDELRAKYARIPAGEVTDVTEKKGSPLKCPTCGAVGPCYFVVRCGECLKGPWGRVILFTHCALCGGPAKCLMDHWAHQAQYHPKVMEDRALNEASK